MKDEGTKSYSQTSISDRFVGKFKLNLFLFHSANLQKSGQLNEWNKRWWQKRTLKMYLLFLFYILIKLYKIKYMREFQLFVWWNRIYKFKLKLGWLLNRWEFDANWVDERYFESKDDSPSGLTYTSLFEFPA